MQIIIDGPGANDAENWRDVAGYEGLYKVSDKGRVYSIPRPSTKGGLLNIRCARGYKLVSLSKDGTEKSLPVHRIVLTAFVPNRLGKPQVNHIDGDKANNKLENLEWATQSENQLHAYSIGLQKPNVREAHKVRHEQTKRKIAQLDMNGKELQVFNSIKEAAKHIGKDDGTHISAVARGKRNSTGGFKWKYIS